MGESVARIGFGMSLGYSDTAEGTPTPLVDLIEIKPFGISVDEAETTHHASPDSAEETEAGLIKFQPLEAKVSWTKTAYPSFTALLRLTKYWTVTYPGGSKDVFPGFIIDISPETPLKERMTCSLKIKPKGLSVFTPAA
jgi:hypothetical protein